MMLETLARLLHVDRVRVCVVAPTASATRAMSGLLGELVRVALPFGGGSLSTVSSVQQNACVAFQWLVRRGVALWPIMAHDAVGVSWDDDVFAVRTMARLAWGDRECASEILLAACGPSTTPMTDVPSLQLFDYAEAVERVVLRNRRFCVIAADGSLREDVRLSGATVLSGSFNPLHDGHIGLAAAAACSEHTMFELSLVNVDKPPMDRNEALCRAAQFAGAHDIILSSAPTFVSKCELFGGPVRFAVGVDTADRLPRPQYYSGAEGAEMARRAFVERQCRFVVAGRVDPTTGAYCAQPQVPPQWEALMDIVPFRNDTSSTSLRSSLKTSL